MLKFPNDFAWGAATSGPQSEGTFKRSTKTFLIIGMPMIQINFMTE